MESESESAGASVSTKCVQAKNGGEERGAFTGGGAKGVFESAAVVGSALTKGNAKKPGEGVLVPCDKCHTNNETKMTMSNMAQFECGECGERVRWRPRQVWLRDQGCALERPIHLEEGEVDEVSCCVVS